jgi:hypothetical protein
MSALDKLGLAITDAGYTWTPEMRKAYEKGVRQEKREWVGLTDEEIDTAVKSCNTVDTYKYFRAIEAKLKEKNT